MSKIFVSHSSKDADKINKLVESFEKLGCQVFYTSHPDRNTIGYGEDIIKTATCEIENADIVFFMVSDNFYESKVALVERGISYALKKKEVIVYFNKSEVKSKEDIVFEKHLLHASLDSEPNISNFLHEYTNDVKKRSKNEYRKYLDDLDMFAKEIMNEINESLIKKKYIEKYWTKLDDIEKYWNEFAEIGEYWNEIMEEYSDTQDDNKIMPSYQKYINILCKE